jgi:hypothetical protein
MMRLALILFSLTLWSCAWGATSMPYPIKQAPIKEATISAEKRDIAWLDNTHVLFRGFTGVEPGPGVQIAGGKEVRMLNEGAYVWDITAGTWAREARFDYVGSICVLGEYRSYTAPTEDNKSSKRRAFESGKEIALPERFWYNPQSCRAHPTRPPWDIDGRATVPLLEEHGYLDRGVKGQDQIKNFPLLYYRTGSTQPLPLELGSKQVDPHIRYYPFLDAYLLEGQRGPLWAPPLWVLHSDGAVEQVFNPEGQAWAKQDWPWLELTKRGPVFASLDPRGPHHSADAGLYLWADGVLTRVAEGFFTMHAVSPEGCKLAVIKSRPERPLPVEKLYRLQIIDLCQGGPAAPSPR